MSTSLIGLNENLIKPYHASDTSVRCSAQWVTFYDCYLISNTYRATVKNQKRPAGVEACAAVAKMAPKTMKAVVANKATLRPTRSHTKPTKNWPRTAPVYCVSAIHLSCQVKVTISTHQLIERLTLWSKQQTYNQQDTSPWIPPERTQIVNGDFFKFQYR